MVKRKKEITKEITVEIFCNTCLKKHGLKVWGKNKMWNRLDQLFFSFSHKEAYPNFIEEK